MFVGSFYSWSRTRLEKVESTNEFRPFNISFGRRQNLQSFYNYNEHKKENLLSSSDLRRGDLKKTHRILKQNTPSLINTRRN